jgi:VanZ family protein
MSVSARLVMVWGLVILAGTLAPFDFASLVEVHTHSSKMFQYGSFERDPFDFLFNMLLFMPLGTLLHHEGQRRSFTLRHVVILTAATGLLLSTTIEYLQAFLPSRDSSLIDVLSNTAGAVMGVHLDRAWGASVEGYFDRLRARTSSAALVRLLLGFLVVALLVSALLQTRARLSNWSADYPLLVGNEQTGDRPWRGRVFALAISDAATPSPLVARFSAGESVAQPGSSIATFDFSGTAPYRDATGNLPDLDSTERPLEPLQGGATLTVRNWLRSKGPASRLAQRLGETNAFTLRLSCATGDTTQDGTARIVSNSASPFLRNFTLGQERTDLVVRLRTPETGGNGMPPETIVPGVFSTDGRRDLLVTYDGATLSIAAAQTHQIVRTAFSPATAVALLVVPYVPAQDLPLYNVAYLGALFFLPPGALVGLLGRHGRDRLVAGLVYLIAAAVLLEPILVMASGRAFAWSNVGLTAGVGAAVLCATSMIFWQGDLCLR